MDIKQFKKKLEQLRARIPKEVERIIYANEQEILSMNIQNIDDHIGSDGRVLKNTNKRYSGRYTLLTQMIASTQNTVLPKTAGDLYNWRWNGAFMSGFKHKVLRGGYDIEIYSTEEGTGDKKAFFDGYKNLYGLTNEDKKVLNEEIIKPELEKFIKRHL